MAVFMRGDELGEICGPMAPRPKSPDPKDAEIARLKKELNRQIQDRRSVAKDLKWRLEYACEERNALRSRVAELEKRPTHEQWRMILAQVNELESRCRSHGKRQSERASHEASRMAWHLADMKIREILGVSDGVDLIEKIRELAGKLRSEVDDPPGTPTNPPSRADDHEFNAVLGRGD